MSISLVELQTYAVNIRNNVTDCDERCRLPCIDVSLGLPMQFISTLRSYFEGDRSAYFARLKKQKRALNI